MLKIIALSKDKDKGVRTIEATFSHNGELIPLKVNEQDRPENYTKIITLLESPNLNIVEAGETLYDLMSPVAKVRKHIESSYYLSDNMSIEDGVIKFGEHELESALSSHMLSLLDEDNTPKDETLWKSYVKFLDNLHQNVNEDIRSQLFKWIEYENAAGNGFGITEDGCIVGYKGCQGTVLLPESVHSGRAIVDGVEMQGRIPNKIGSVVTMPRSSVQYDPEVGCSTGLHVGTRDYAISWAPVLLLVKVNPRDVVSVPYECSSQKMRVCEYTVLKITDPSEEHQRFFPDKVDDDYTSNLVTLSEARELLNREVYVEYDEGESDFEGTVVNVFEDGLPGIVIRNENNDYKHIKLERISYIETLDDQESSLCDDEFEFDFEDDFEDDDFEDDDFEYDDCPISKTEILELIGERVFVSYGDEKEYQGVLVDLYDDSVNPGVIIRGEDGSHKHIKLSRINHWITLIKIEEDEDFPEEDESNVSTASKSDVFSMLVGDLYKPIYELKPKTNVIIVYKDGFEIKPVKAKVVKTVKNDMELHLLLDDKSELMVPFENIMSLQVLL